MVIHCRLVVGKIVSRLSTRSSHSTMLTCQRGGFVFARLIHERPRSIIHSPCMCLVPVFGLGKHKAFAFPRFKLAFGLRVILNSERSFQVLFAVSASGADLLEATV